MFSICCQTLNIYACIQHEYWVSGEPEIIPTRLINAFFVVSALLRAIYARL